MAKKLSYENLSDNEKLGDRKFIVVSERAIKEYIDTEIKKLKTQFENKINSKFELFLKSLENKQNQKSIK